MGAKKRPFYRVVVAEKRSKRDGKFVEIVGHYNPCSSPAQLVLDQERVQHWINCGAQPTDTVRSLIRKNAAAHPPVAAAVVEAPVVEATVVEAAVEAEAAA
jgi:small subunit ribosomal protein S16